jgi:RNA polymerase sigma-70 factor, ECF subfamily
MDRSAQRSLAPLVALPLDAEQRDRAWMARVRSGDYQAFEALFRTYGGPLCAYVDSVIQAPDEAQDLVQELFLWIWDHRADWTVPGAISTYLYRSARNRAISHLRHRRVEQRFRDVWHRDVASQPARRNHGDTADRANTDELRRIVARTVNELPDRCRQVFILSRHHALAYAQIAEVMQISVKTVEVHMARALSGLRKELGDWL